MGKNVSKRMGQEKESQTGQEEKSHPEARWVVTADHHHDSITTTARSQKSGIESDIILKRSSIALTLLNEVLRADNSTAAFTGI